MSQLLTNRQAEELHKAIIAYLNVAKLPSSAAALRQELEIGDSFDDTTSKKYEGLLEKKWTSVVRLQKKIMDLESRNANLQSELDSATPTSLSRRNMDPASWLPRSPARHTLQSHRSPVTCVAFHPIFSSLASGSEDATLKIWDWELGELERTIKSHTKAVLDADYGGPRGATLLASCSSDLTIKLWDPSDEYKNIRTLPGHDHSISAVRFIPSGAAGAPSSGNLLVSASRDKTLRIWDVTTGYCVKTLRGHADWVRDVAPSFDGRWLLSAGNDQTARLWDATSGEVKATFLSHEHVIECCTFAPAAAYGHLATIAGLKKAPASNSSGEFLATGSRDKSIKLWDSRGTLIKTLTGHDNWVRAVVFHPGGKYLISVSDDKTIRCWDLAQEGKCVKTISDAHEHFVSSIRWAPGVIKNSGTANGDINGAGSKKDDPGGGKEGSSGKARITKSDKSVLSDYVINPSPSPAIARSHSKSNPARNQQHAANARQVQDDEEQEETKNESVGAMSRRLGDMTEESLERGGRAAQKAIDEAGFSEELKKRLEARIQDTKFRSENPAAFAQMEMPSSAGKGTQQIAAAQPWSGTETVEDGALRMLTDVNKPMRGPVKIPKSKPPTVSLDMRMKKAIQKSQGERLANARDRTSVYALSQDPNLTEKEKEMMRKQLKERFTAGARPMPASVQGLAALANERIEDAIARGQFKNIPRGKGTNIEKDYTANSPFLDTTEYFMNKIIKKQEIVPPWIEKQQELVKAAAVFRSRLRADWKRHAARVIASKGGSIDAQVRRARAYAAAEAAINPQKPKREALSEIDEEGRLTQVTVTESPAPATGSSESKITISESLAADSPSMDTSPNQPEAPSTTPSPASTPPSAPTSTPPSPPLPSLPPFRDPAWQSLEHAYHTLAITSLNSLTRSYNLQAPSLAQKPYFSLDRELRACFADVAPLLPDEIRERARRPLRAREEVVGHRAGGVMERFGGERARVWDDRRVRYGWREFWRELWGR